MERELQNILDAIASGIVVLDTNGNVRHLNAEACRVLESSAAAVRGRAIEDALGPDHAISKLARNVLASGRATLENELRVPQRFGAELVVDVAASPLLEADGNLGGVIVEIRDRTIHSTLRDVVEARSQLNSFGHIAAGIAHEVKNPLGGIRGAAELLARRTSDTKTREASDLIVRESDRIATLLDDFMVLGQDQRLEYRLINIHQLLDDVLDLLTMDPVAAGISLKRSFDPSIPEFQADPDRLTQVFLNLVRNALQAMAGSGTVTIATRMSLDLHLSSDDGERLPSISVEIRDTGPGIAQAVLRKLATPFFTTRPDGTGLGLTVSQHWVARHGGHLNIDSTPGEGTRVQVLLPLRRSR